MQGNENNYNQYDMNTYNKTSNNENQYQNTNFKLNQRARIEKMRKESRENKKTTISSYIMTRSIDISFFLENIKKDYLKEFQDKINEYLNKNKSEQNDLKDAINKLNETMKIATNISPENRKMVMLFILLMSNLYNLVMNDKYGYTKNTVGNFLNDIIEELNIATKENYEENIDKIIEFILNMENSENKAYKKLHERIMALLEINFDDNINNSNDYFDVEKNNTNNPTLDYDYNNKINFNNNINYSNDYYNIDNNNTNNPTLNYDYGSKFNIDNNINNSNDYFDVENNNNIINPKLNYDYGSKFNIDNNINNSNFNYNYYKKKNNTNNPILDYDYNNKINFNNNMNNSNDYFDVENNNNIINPKLNYDYGSKFNIDNNINNSNFNYNYYKKKNNTNNPKLNYNYKINFNNNINNSNFSYSNKKYLNQENNRIDVENKFINKIKDDINEIEQNADMLKHCENKLKQDTIFNIKKDCKKILLSMIEYFETDINYYEKLSEFKTHTNYYPEEIKEIMKKIMFRFIYTTIELIRSNNLELIEFGYRLVKDLNNAENKFEVLFNLNMKNKDYFTIRLYRVLTQGYESDIIKILKDIFINNSTELNSNPTSAAVIRNALKMNDDIKENTKTNMNIIRFYRELRELRYNIMDIETNSDEADKIEFYKNYIQNIINYCMDIKNKDNNSYIDNTIIMFDIILKKFNIIYNEKFYGQNIESLKVINFRFLYILMKLTSSENISTRNYGKVILKKLYNYVIKIEDENECLFILNFRNKSNIYNLIYKYNEILYDLLIIIYDDYYENLLNYYAYKKNVSDFNLKDYLIFSPEEEKYIENELLQIDYKNNKNNDSDIVTKLKENMIEFYNTTGVIASEKDIFDMINSINIHKNIKFLNNISNYVETFIKNLNDDVDNTKEYNENELNKVELFFKNYILSILYSILFLHKNHHSLFDVDSTIKLLRIFHDAFISDEIIFKIFKIEDLLNRLSIFYKQSKKIKNNAIKIIETYIKLYLDCEDNLKFMENIKNNFESPLDRIIQIITNNEFIKRFKLNNNEINMLKEMVIIEDKREKDKDFLRQNEDFYNLGININIYELLEDTIYDNNLRKLILTEDNLEKNRNYDRISEIFLNEVLNPDSDNNYINFFNNTINNTKKNIKTEEIRQRFINLRNLFEGKNIDSYDEYIEKQNENIENNFKEIQFEIIKELTINKDPFVIIDILSKKCLQIIDEEMRKRGRASLSKYVYSIKSIIDSLTQNAKNILNSTSISNILNNKNNKIFIKNLHNILSSIYILLYLYKVNLYVEDDFINVYDNLKNNLENERTEEFFKGLFAEDYNILQYIKTNKIIFIYLEKNYFYDDNNIKNIEELMDVLSKFSMFKYYYYHMSYERIKDEIINEIMFINDINRNKLIDDELYKINTKYYQKRYGEEGDFAEFLILYFIYCATHIKTTYFTDIIYNNGHSHNKENFLIEEILRLIKNNDELNKDNNSYCIIKFLKDIIRNNKRIEVLYNKIFKKKYDEKSTQQIHKFFSNIKKNKYINPNNNVNQNINYNKYINLNNNINQNINYNKYINLNNNVNRNINYNKYINLNNNVNQNINYNKYINLNNNVNQNINYNKYINPNNIIYQNNEKSPEILENDRNILDSF